MIWSSIQGGALSMATAAARLLPPELAHTVGLRLLASPLRRYLPRPPDDIPPVDFGTLLPGVGSLRHPIGLAAGWDKDAEALAGYGYMGFAFAEVGTVTPRPQPGNARPRLWRQKDQMALVNRMGFNSAGVNRVVANLDASRWEHDALPIGVNVGKNRETPSDMACADFAHVARAAAKAARFFVVNISSPNTPGLRDLATPEFLGELAGEMGRDLMPRVWLKLDPDMERRPFQAMVEASEKLGFQGLVLTNTRKVTWPWRGGQSGHPLAVASATRLEWAWEAHRGRLPMIASGGVLSGADVYQKLIRGASAVEILTAIVYRGPWAVSLMLSELAAELQSHGATSVQEVVGSFYDR